MMRVLRQLLAMGIAALLLSGCTSAPQPSVSASPAASGSAGSVGPSAPADAITLNITIKNRQVNPSGDKINVARGQTVIMHVTSDMDDEVHAHNSGAGYELEVKAGQPATGQFVATDIGTFEVESHHLNKVIVILVVR